LIPIKHKNKNEKQSNEINNTAVVTHKLCIVLWEEQCPTFGSEAWRPHSGNDSPWGVIVECSEKVYWLV
jgi:hypothetical protein